MSDRPRVTDWTADWDFGGRQYHEEAIEVWAELRAHCPIAHTGRYGGAWALVRHRDIAAVAHDPATFSSHQHTLHDEYPDNKMAQPPIDMDPPEHTALRRILLPQFGPPAVEALRPHTEQVCEALLDGLAGRRAFDAASEYARHVPLAVIAEMLDIPDIDIDRFGAWVHAIVETPDDLDGMVRAFREAISYFRGQLDRHREEPGDDLISLLVRSEVDGAPLLDRTITATAIVMLLAGMDTVWTVLSAAILHLGRHPDEAQRLRDEPELLDSAIEEFLRFYAPAELSRLVTRDTEVGGVAMRAGEHVLMSFPAANRDPDVFPDPDVFRIDRSPNRHVAFGIGIHRCIGSNLARMQLHVALAAWLRRFPSFTVDPRHPVQLTTGGIIRGPRTVPLVVEPVVAAGLVG